MSENTLLTGQVDEMLKDIARAQAAEPDRDVGFELIRVVMQDKTSTRNVSIGGAAGVSDTVAALSSLGTAEISLGVAFVMANHMTNATMLRVWSRPRVVLALKEDAPVAPV